MSTDYPDFTRPYQIVGSDINVPIDVKAQTVALGVVIAASEITLDVNLAASDITLDINIAATAVTLDVNLKAQDVTINIDIDAQSVGIYLQPEWAALQGMDKNLKGSAFSQAWAGNAIIAYTVPSGKTLYLCGMSMVIHVHTPTDYDHFIYGELELYSLSGGIALANIGGLGGCYAGFTKPITFAEDIAVRVYGWNRSNITCDIRITAWGYEI